MKRKQLLHGSKHHIRPRSRGGKTEKHNLSHLGRTEHQNYHTLFVNKTPEEIIDLLVNHFWLSEDGENGFKYIEQWLNNNYFFNGGYLK
jgi:hypothetical protein